MNSLTSFASIRGLSVTGLLKLDAVRSQFLPLPIFSRLGEKISFDAQPWNELLKAILRPSRRSVSKPNANRERRINHVGTTSGNE